METVLDQLRESHVTFLTYSTRDTFAITSTDLTNLARFVSSEPLCKKFKQEFSSTPLPRMQCVWMAHNFFIAM